MTMTPSSNYMSAVVALKASAASQGAARPAGLYIAAWLHQAVDNAVSSPARYQFPTEGNCFVQAIQGGGPNFFPSAVTDTAGNTWAFAPGYVNNAWDTLGTGNEANTFWYAGNATPSGTLTVTNTYVDSGMGHLTSMFLDIVGAATAPFDQRTSTSWRQTSPANLVAPPGVPVTTSNELVIFQEQQGLGTTIGVSGGTGIRLASATFKSNTTNGPSNADQNNGWAHWLNTGTAATGPTWTNNAGAGGINYWLADGMAILPSGVTGILPYFIQRTNTGGSGITTNLTAFSYNNTSGNMIVVAVQTVQARTVTITDTRGNIYLTAVPLTAYFGSGHAGLGIYYATNIAAGANTVQTKISGANSFISSCIHEYHGVSLFDQFKTNKLTSVSALTSTASPNTTAATELIFGAFSDDGSGGNYQPSSTDSMRNTRNSSMFTSEHVTTTTNTQTWTATADSATSGSAAVVTFK